MVIYRPQYELSYIRLYNEVVFLRGRWHAYTRKGAVYAHYRVLEGEAVSSDDGYVQWRPKRRSWVHSSGKTCYSLVFAKEADGSHVRVTVNETDRKLVETGAKVYRAVFKIVGLHRRGCLSARDLKQHKKIRRARRRVIAELESVQLM